MPFGFSVYASVALSLKTFGVRDSWKYVKVLIFDGQDYLRKWLSSVIIAMNLRVVVGEWGGGRCYAKHPEGTERGIS